MGVSWVFEHDKTAKEVERLLEGGGAEQIGTFTVDCLPYTPNDKLTGVEYRLRDFVVRVGTATQVTTTKGVIVEVEYEPSQVAAQSAHMMTEMMQMFFPQYARNKPDVINKSSSEPYSALDTMYQYLTIFRNMRKKA
ncbi:hypothetical protein TELCIR_14890 [Teladorsagia circumcincta]|uniref:Mediator of RNA polymerase II transcription subunit 20 n=1 Tax=Teladorsagia circumcincta TaxID=45464 RepID=A0A2G9U1D6_TELCI|nr:hypothetical protein TELCIR_14890 [Teladorsagia circumcincta]